MRKVESEKKGENKKSTKNRNFGMGGEVGHSEGGKEYRKSAVGTAPNQNALGAN